MFPDSPKAVVEVSHSYLSIWTRTIKISNIIYWQGHLIAEVRFIALRWHSKIYARDKIQDGSDQNKREVDRENEMK